MQSETFIVPIIDCINLVVYIQKNINNILYPLRAFVRAYIKDIVIDAGWFEKHVADLQVIFNFFIQFNILIKLFKIFFNYPSINYLGQHINLLSLISAENKLAAVKTINYPIILGNLEYFLGLTKYLRSSMHYYI